MMDWTNNLLEQAQTPGGLALIGMYRCAQKLEKGIGLVCLIKG